MTTERGKRSLAVLVQLAAAGLCSLIAIWPDPVVRATHPVAPDNFWTSDRVAHLRSLAGLYAAGFALLVVLPSGGPVADGSSVRLSRWDCLGLALITSVALFVRLRFINLPLDYDEAYSFLNYARSGPLAAVARLDSTNNHLLNSLAMALAYQVAGFREWALRLAVLFCGACLPAATYLAGRFMGLGRAAWAAAALTCWSPALVEYSTNARGYMISALGNVVAAMGLVQGRAWLAAGSFAFSLAATPLALPSVAGATLWLVTKGWPWTRALRWLVSLLMAAGLVYIPGLVSYGLHAARHPFVQPLPFDLWVRHFGPAAAEGLAIALVSWPMDGVAAKVAMFPHVARWFEQPEAWWSMALVAVMAYGASRRPSELSVPVAIVGGFLLFLAFRRLAPPPRVFVPFAPFCLLALASALPQVSRAAFMRAGRVAFLLWLALVIAFYQQRPLPYRPADQNWRLDVPAAARAISQAAQGRLAHVLAALPADMPLRVYLDATKARWRWGVSPSGSTYLVWFAETRLDTSALQSNPVTAEFAEQLEPGEAQLVVRFNRLAVFVFQR